MANVSNINASRPQIQGTALDQATKLAGDSTNAKAVISKAMEVLAGANLSVTKADSSGATGAAERKTTGGTNVPALDDPGDAQQVAANLEKLVSYLQLDNQDRQTEMAKDRLEMQKGNLDAEHKDRMEQIDKSIKKMKDAEKASIWSRAFSWIGAIVAVVAAAVLTVVTGGLAAGFAIAGAAIAVSSLLLNETGAMDKIVNALADHMKSAHGMSRSDAKLAASLICNLTLCVASLGCGIGSMVSGATSAAVAAGEDGAHGHDRRQHRRRRGLPRDRRRQHLLHQAVRGREGRHQGAGEVHHAAPAASQRDRGGTPAASPADRGRRQHDRTDDRLGDGHERRDRTKPGSNGVRGSLRV